MRNLIVIAAVILGAAGLYASVSPAGEQGVTPRQVAALRHDLTALQKRVRTLEAFRHDCFRRALPIVVYGHPPTEGYLYRAADGNYGAVQALNLAPRVEAATAFLPDVGLRCAATMKTRATSGSGGSP